MILTVRAGTTRKQCLKKQRNAKYLWQIVYPGGRRPNLCAAAGEASDPTCPARGVKNVVYVATVNNSVYAFDADSANEQAAFWQVSLTAPSARPVNKADMTGACGGFYKAISQAIWVLWAHLLSTTTNTLYVVAKFKNKYEYLLSIPARAGYYHRSGKSQQPGAYHRNCEW